MKNQKLTKIVIELQDSLFGAESLWVKDLGRDQFELANVPFFATKLNFGDVVKAIAPKPEWKPHFKRLVRHGSHRTLRFLFANDTKEKFRKSLIKALAKLGCLTESFNEALPLVCVSIPAKVNYSKVKHLLASHPAEVWYFKHWPKAFLKEMNRQ